MEIDLIGILMLVLVCRTIGVILSRIGIQSIVGEVSGGIIVGVLVVGGFLAMNQSTMTAFADLGIILIMLLAGLVTDFKSFSNNTRTSILVGGMGVLVSFAVAFVPLMLLSTKVFGITTGKALVSSLFIAVILSNTAIEVSASLFTKKSATGSLYSIVMGASFVDDIIAVFLIGIVSSIAISDRSFTLTGVVELSIIVGLFLLVSFVLVTRAVEWIFDRFLGGREKDEQKLLTATILLGFLFAILARQVGLHEVIGAYIAGLVVGKWGSKLGPLLKRRLAWIRLIKDIDPPLRAIFGPLFFGFIGVTFSMVIIENGFGTAALLLSLLFLTVAILGKVLGCGVGSMLAGYGSKEALVVGAAMCGRGALELVLLRYGVELEIITEGAFLALVLTTLYTIVLTPVLYTASKKWYDRHSTTGEFS